jgi:hypothetical protein
MSKTLQIGNQTFEYPEQGDGTWGEEASSWAQAVTEALATVQGPEDILLTEALITNGSSGNVSGLAFDTSLVQQIVVEGLLVRSYLDATPTEAEAFVATGAYNGSVFNISMEYAGNDTGVVLDIDNAGQFTYVAENRAQTNTILIKFKGKAIIAD